MSASSVGIGVSITSGLFDIEGVSNVVQPAMICLYRVLASSAASSVSSPPGLSSEPFGVHASAPASQKDWQC